MMRKTICDNERLEEEFPKEISLFICNKENESNEKYTNMSGSFWQYDISCWWYEPLNVSCKYALTGL
jgi:hypothetical protein